ncbi:MAG TPA: hypothetical protein VI685_28360 [Candidatus Angelobacter sp.]
MAEIRVKRSGRGVDNDDLHFSDHGDHPITGVPITPVLGDGVEVTRDHPIADAIKILAGEVTDGSTRSAVGGAVPWIAGSATKTSLATSAATRFSSYYQ